MNSAIRNLLLTAFVAFVSSSPLESKSLADIDIFPLADTPDYRLSDALYPTYYHLSLTPYFKDEGTNKAFTFDATAKITILKKNLTLPANQIVLHVNNLLIASYDIFLAGSTTQNIKKDIAFDNTTYDLVTDKWTVDVGQDIPASGVDLIVRYKGYMLDDMAGFYRSYYWENGAKVWLGTTQLQQTDARRVFPCFDEPRFKAVIKLEINHPEDMNAISNVPEVFRSTPPVNGRVTTTFGDTPKMSSYLLAFIVSKYAVRNDTQQYLIVARPDAVNAGAADLAMNFGKEMLDKFGTEFNFSYYKMDKMTKMHTAAIPDFSAGAMENWGLLTYRETSSLYYPEDTPSINEQRIVAVIAHEQAHQWFGDLLTCSWWSETWLNEGFARYFQYFGTKLIKTNWNLEEQFVVENHQQSMQLDSTDSTHAMTNPEVATKAQVGNMFDNISYNKAASIIRMMSYYLTSKAAFTETLQYYLDKNQYTAVVPDDLFSAFELKNPGSDVGKIFGSWASTKGFPMVTVSRQNKTLTLKQHRFMRESGIVNDKNEKYNIPINYAIDSEGFADTTFTKVFRITDSPEIKIELPKEPQRHYILNKQQVGYYRVNYDEENWKSIRTALYSDSHDGIHVLNRAQIVDDLFQFARAGTVEYKTAIDIIRYLKNETDYIPWLSAINLGLTHLSQRVKNEDKDQKLFSWFISTDLMDNIYEKLQFEPPTTTEDRTKMYNRVNVITWACKYGHEKCVEKSKELFKKYQADKKKIHKDIRAVVYCNGVRYGGEEEFNFLYNLYNETNILQEQLNLLSGMGCTKEKALAEKYLNRLLTTEDIRRQDYSAAYNYLLNGNPVNVDLFYDFVTEKQAAWRAKFEGLGVLNTIAGRFTAIGQFDKYEKFLTDNKAGLGDALHSSLLASMNSIKTANLDWDEKKMKAFMDYLEEINGASMSVFSIILSVTTFTFLYIFN